MSIFYTCSENSYFVSSGNDGATGRGVWRDVIYTMENNVIHDENWQVVEDDGHFSLLLRLFDVVPYSDSTLARFRAIGLFIWLCLIWQIEPLQISPLLIAYLVSQSLDVSTDPGLLRHVSPRMESRLTAWPPVRIDSVLSPAFHLITQASDGDYPVCVIFSLQYFTNILYRSILSGNALPNNSRPWGLLFALR